MGFLQRSLNDPNLESCGKCANCSTPISAAFSHENGLKASEFLKNSEIIFSPKKQVKLDALAIYGIKGNIPGNIRAEEGRILSRWEDAGWGRVVSDNKHNGYFEDKLVEAFANMIQKWNPTPYPSWVTCVPSLNHTTLVPSFAKRVADKLGLPFMDAIKKIKQNQPQKMMNNAYYQAKNLDGIFGILDSIPNTPVLLIDDVIDSGWTITVISTLLRQKGSGIVYPTALATTGKM